MSEPELKMRLESLVQQMYSSNITYDEGVREFRKRWLLTALDANDGNQCRAARDLGMHRNTLSRSMAELAIPAARRNGKRR